MESKVQQPCPICHVEGGLIMGAHTDEIPYFGEHTQLTLRCESCGWRHTDFIPNEGELPGKSTLKLSQPEHLNTRIVRGASATIQIPELGLEVEPGASSGGYVSNIEGVFQRFRGICEMLFRDLASNDSEDQQKIPLIQSIIESIDGAIKGDFGTGLTIVMLDPSGHSKILHADATQRELTDDEVAELATGPSVPVIDAADLEDDNDDEDQV
jgi:zinc finger protein